MQRTNVELSLTENGAFRTDTVFKYSIFPVLPLEEPYSIIIIYVVNYILYNFGYKVYIHKYT